MVDDQKCFAFQVIIITILESQIANRAHEDKPTIQGITGPYNATAPAGESHHLQPQHAWV